MSFSRRIFLETTANPDPGHDYLVRLAGNVAGASLAVRFVPDQLVLNPAGFAGYRAALAQEPWPALEALAITVLEDLNNELVPRWVQVVATREAPHTHEVVIEDRQPGWHNPLFIARLGVL
ncbi:MAG TPA: hypothetical protein VEB64_13275 [Azospirillaceae bacterium]|nr:hypothetical protein [Azospirillaceae bacterium]